MKKIPLLVLSSILAIALSIPGQAAESQIPISNDEWSSVLDSFDENEYGGAYLDGDILHIKPVEFNDIKAEMKQIQRNNVSNSQRNVKIVVDDVATYTYQELLDAKDKVFDLSDDLGIVTVGISNKNNSIVVGAEEWNEEKEQAVQEVAEIENIIFETKNIFDSNVESNYSATIQSKKVLGVADIYIGDEIDGDNGRCTLGACATIGNREGYVSCGHGKEIGDIFYLYGKRLGVVTEQHYGGSVDAAFIEKDSRSVYPLTDKLRLSSNLSRTGRITSSGEPVLEGAVVCYGTGSGYRIAIVEDTEYSTNINGTRFRNLIRFDIGGEAGDSGGPVVIPKSNNKYRLVGIWKGIDRYGDGIAIRWDKIEDEFGVELY